MEPKIPTGEGLTFEKVWLMFQESDRKFEKMRLEAEKEREKEREKEQKEADIRREKEQKEQKEQKEAEEKREKDRKVADERFDKRMQEQYEKTNAIIGRLGNRIGDFVEGLVRPGVVRLFNERGIPIGQTAQHLQARRGDEGMEVDLVGINWDEMVVVEVKSRLTVEDVRDHLYRMEHFKRFFPQYTDKRLIGAVAGMVITEESDKFAYRQGLFVIAQTGETVQLLNDAQFIPKHW